MVQDLEKVVCLSHCGSGRFFCGAACKIMENPSEAMLVIGNRLGSVSCIWCDVCYWIGLNKSNVFSVWCITFFEKHPQVGCCT